MLPDIRIRKNHWMVVDLDADERVVEEGHGKTGACVDAALEVKQHLMQRHHITHEECRARLIRWYEADMQRVEAQRLAALKVDPNTASSSETVWEKEE